ncbi:GNAT family N-acetyltransferase [Paenibacillus whitsoniae]|uniref:GNAT family N-acetyltransferase n=1 Tax=Paenibacillus whitsoniae TaxID=2496558 RepID=A0A430JDK3_9BACL|nr:GNAT family N-acetyltransferase [Paenibacillus whitsoniae]RTE09089.1 GNAT family N-acetyltransferase [Paenibacillus whitsoniae]
MSQVIVREAVPHDVPALRELMLAYIVDFYQYPAPEEDKLNALIHKLLDQIVGIQFVAVAEDGGLVGFATLYFTYSTLRATQVTVMNDLFVVASERGKDVAAKLFLACKAYSAKHGYGNMSWVTARDNARAQAFYDKMGGQRSDWQDYSIDPAGSPE